MHVDPLQVFEQRDIARAHRLNRVLAHLPRYHTGRRTNSRMLNAVISVGQRLAPKPRRNDIDLSVVPIEVRGVKRDVRLFRPARGADTLLLHFHGGAWVLGNARLDDSWNASIARRANLAVAGADFHLATDDRLDRTIEDAVAVTEWVLDHLDRFGATQLLLGGESSGAHLAACSLVRLATRRSLEAVIGFVSFCGAFDLAGSDSLKQSDGRTLIVDAPSAYHNLQRLTEALPPGAVHSPEFSPHLADLAGMPPALFVAGALDPILEDSEKMYDRWVRSSGNADLLVVPEAPHGFERLPTKLAQKALAFAGDWMKAIPARSGTMVGSGPLNGRT